MLFIRWCAKFLFLWVCSDAKIVARRSTIHLSQYSISPSALSVTGFFFNKQPGPSKWVERLFLSQALLWKLPIKFKGWRGQATGIDVPAAVEAFREQFHAPATMAWPECSIEILGFVPLNVTTPFLGLVDKYNKASVGTAALSSSNGILATEPLQCYYRGMYENWLKLETTSPVKRASYRAVFFYCPASSSKRSCDMFLQQYIVENKTVEVHHEISMDVPQQHPWRTGFSTFIENDDSTQIDVEEYGPSLCTTWPYRSSFAEKVAVNNALMLEYLRYHALLGFRIFVFDRSGSNLDALTSSAYANAAAWGSDSSSLLHLLRNRVDYRNYTIMSLMGGSANHATVPFSDREDAHAGRHGFEFDLDKSLSLTQCRFEARSKYGLETALVSDFDEFLFCSPGRNINSTAKAQQDIINKCIEDFSRRGIEQVTVDKVQLLRKSVNETVTRCLSRQVLEAANGGSIFDCFPSVMDIDHVNNVKSIHLSYACPYTNFHHSCAPTSDTLNAYDCLCKSEHTEQCYLVHLSLTQSNHHRRSKSLLDASSVECELKAVVT